MKVKAILDMHLLRTIQDVQKLICHLAMSKFINHKVLSVCHF